MSSAIRTARRLSNLARDRVESNRNGSKLDVEMVSLLGGGPKMLAQSNSQKDGQLTDIDSKG